MTIAKQLLHLYPYLPLRGHLYDVIPNPSLISCHLYCSFSNKGTKCPQKEEIHYLLTECSLLIKDWPLDAIWGQHCAKFSLKTSILI